MKIVSQTVALKTILNNVTLLETENVPIDDCYGRTVAKDVVSKIYSPATDCSAMDGFGVGLLGANHLSGYQLVGEIPAGKSFNKKIQKGEAVRIFTGASIPKGVDKVFPQERLKDSKLNLLNFFTSDNTFIRGKGSNFEPGFTIKKHSFLNPRLISLLAAMNNKRVPVIKKTKIAIISIGDELRYPGSTLGSSSIAASNGYGLKAFFESKNSNVHLKPIVLDNQDLITHTIKESFNYDIIVTIGGASVGKYDLVKEAATEAGVKFFFTGVNVKPGKPFKAGKKGKSLFLSLPGNPVSSILCSQIFIGPVLDYLQKMPLKSKIFQANLLEPLNKNGSRKHFMRSTLIRKREDFWIKPFKNQDSHNLVTLSKANSLIVRNQNDGKKVIGDLVKVLKLEI